MNIKYNYGEANDNVYFQVFVDTMLGESEQDAY